MVRARVLVVEDDEEFQNFYKSFFGLHEEEFSWVLAKTGDSAVAALRAASQPFDVVLIDWCLKQGAMDGLQVLRAVRSDPAGRRALAFMVTANDRERDIQDALEAEADDYILKPFKAEDLAARLRGRLHRRKETPGAPKTLELGGLKLDAETGHLLLNDRRVDLSPTEFALLDLFLEKSDRILTPDLLWHAVRGYQSGTAGKALTVQISNLRKKLGTWGDRIETLRGQGYLFNTRLPVSR